MHNVCVHLHSKLKQRRIADLALQLASATCAVAPCRRRAATTSLEDLITLFNSLLATVAAVQPPALDVNSLPFKKPADDDRPQGELPLTCHSSVRDALLDLAKALAAALADSPTIPPSNTSSSTSAEKSRAPSAAIVQQILDDWADRVLPATAAAAAGSSSNSSRTLARNLFKHLVASLSPGSTSDGASSATPTLLAAAAAASTATAGGGSTGRATAAGSSSDQGRVAGPGGHPEAAGTTSDVHWAGWCNTSVYIIKLLDLLSQLKLHCSMPSWPYD
jgi:hypothetical protein